MNKLLNNIVKRYKYNNYLDDMIDDYIELNEYNRFYDMYYVIRQSYVYKIDNICS